VIHMVHALVQEGKQHMHMLSFQICSTECFKQPNVRYRLVSNRKDADASAAKRGTSATIIIYRTEPQLGYFTSVASIEQPKVYLKSIGGLSCEVNE